MRTLIHIALRRPRVTVMAWAAIIAVAAPFALQLGGVLAGSSDAVRGSESERALRDINRHFGRGTSFAFPAVLSSVTLASDDELFRARVVELDSALLRAGMTAVRHYWNTGDSGLLGRDGKSALILVAPPAKTFFEAEGFVDTIRAVADGALGGSAFALDVTGTISLFHDLDDNASDDLIRAERIGLPLTLVVLLAVFGAPIAAGLPLVVAVGATTLTLAVLYALSHAMPVSVFAQNVVTMVGLGVGVDYALFLVSRCRERLRAGLAFPAAVNAAAHGTVHVLVISALAVCTGFAALLLVRVPFLHTLAIAGVAVVTVAVLMTLTLLPALMIVVGERLNWPRRITQRDRAASTLWARWAAEAMARPWRYLVPTVVVLSVLIMPATRLKAWNVGARDLAPAMDARAGFERLERDFAAGWMGPLALLVEPDGDGGAWSPAQRRAIAAIHARVADDRRIYSADIVPAPGDSAAMIHAIPRDAPESPEVMDLVRELRASDWREARAAGLTVRVGGFSAAIIDFDTEMFAATKRIVPLVLLVTFVFLVLAFRSVVVPLKAIAMNLVSVLTAYGFLVLVFQEGIGASLIGLDPPGGLNSFVVLMLFTILFGLSMDYEVFLLSRIRDEYRRTGDNRESVVRGLSETGGLITSAALIMVVLFGSFGFTRLVPTREFGLGLAFAVAVDATLIRVILIPTMMRLLGRANWWFPWPRAVALNPVHHRGMHDGRGSSNRDRVHGVGEPANAGGVSRVEHRGAHA